MKYENGRTGFRSLCNNGTCHKEAEPSQLRSISCLRDRSKVPFGVYLSVGCVLSLLFSSGLVGKIPNAMLNRFARSIYSVVDIVASLIVHIFASDEDLHVCAIAASYTAHGAITFAFAAASLSGLIFIFIWKPFMAGMWTGSKTKKHKIHRYCGLLFLIQYSFAWLEFVYDYENFKTSYLPLSVALNGVIQAISAYFSFRVLPELDDSGFISDKSVLSRNFVFENLYYQLMCVFGFFYYNMESRVSLQSHKIGKGLEIIFVFLPYVAIRPFFPVTRFRDAGTNKNGRSNKLRYFYEIGTYLVKFFYLWGKYFLGFFINWLVFLGIPSDDDMVIIHGLYLLNVGTVSIAVFLHTLRFKKVLPPQLTFTFYLGQIYATFCGLPLAYTMFLSHPMLCCLALSGLICNLTRSKLVHSIWSFCSLVVMKVFYTTFKGAG